MMKIELTNTGGLGSRRGSEYWAAICLASEYIGPLCERWSGSIDVVVESFPPNGWRTTWWHKVHWFVEADFGEFCQWALATYSEELILDARLDGMTIEIYDDYRE
jgi:hypothetical protein